MFTRNKIIKTAGLVVALALAVYVGFNIGVEKGKEIERSQNTNGSKSSLIQKSPLFKEAINIVKENYYKPENISDQKLLYGAIRGALNSLEDPYSTFLKPEDAQKFSEDISGNFGGIGAEIGMKDGQLVIISPLKDNPAEKAGLKAGDKILKVNDKVTNDMSIEKAVKLIRGKRGTDVTLLINRENFEKPKEFTITRGNIEIPTLEWKMKDGKIAHMQLYSFNGKAASRFYEASFNALLKGANGLILDLRNNSGGFLQAATEIAGWFLERGAVVVKERFPSGEVKTFRAHGNGAWKNFPVVVLVNEGSASASEILAGALRDQKDATLVGEKTFGKGTVQEVKPLSDGSKVKISVAEWVLPDGQTINNKGLKPDVKVEMDGNVSGDKDPQLQKALEIIRKKAEKQNNKKNQVLPSIR